MWFRCISILMCIIILNCISSFFYLDLTQILSKSDSDISFKSDSNVIQMCFNFLCIIMLKCISFHLIFQILLRFDSDILFKFISVSSVLHYIKMRSHQFLSHFNLHFQFFLISSCFFSLSCRSSVLKREATVMMSSHQFNHHHLNLVSAILF